MANSPSFSATGPEKLYELDQKLYESSLALRDEMGLMAERISRMEEHKDGISEAVYIRVKNDYLVRYDQLKKNFEAKKKEIQKSLHQFYKALQEQQLELQKHKEILEEAQFRRFLGEYSEEKTHEIENRETAEVKTYENLVSMVQSNIRQYEDIIGGPLQEPIAPAPFAQPASIFNPKVEPTVKEKSVEESSPLTALKENPKKASSVKAEKFDNYFIGGDYFENTGAGGESSENTPVKIPLIREEDSVASILENIPLGTIDDTTGSFPNLIEEAPSGFSNNRKLAEAKLIPLAGDLEKEEYLVNDNLSIGRSPSNDIVLKEAKISRQHATVQLKDGKHVIIDLKSSNGITINGVKVEESVLKDGDEVGVGSYRFRYERGG